jgi:SAM-dependent methyltransferase
MGFDPHWLSLREPADAKARDQGLLLQATGAIESLPGRVVLDLGCGSGSTYRSLQPYLNDAIHWRLLDNDRLLLDEVRSRHGGAVETIEMDLGDIDALPFHDVALVTASALFDLCSAEFIDRLADRVCAAGMGLYAALNYDGEMSWTDEHALDREITTVFNAHQKTDKGFGMSLGPDAWSALAEALRANGYKVSTAESPWRLAKEDADLQLLLLDGIVEAVQEHGQMNSDDVAVWHSYRRHSAMEGNELCRIGHRDVLALR